MANVIIVCGDTGTGKSTSIKNLNPQETYIVNVLSKQLPFKGSNSLYSVEKKNMFYTTNYGDVKACIEGIASNRPDVKNLIIDDVGFVMTTELFNRAAEAGYTKFTQIGVHMQQILDTSKNQRADLNIVFMFHVDDDISDKIKVGKKIKLIGQMLDDKYNPLAVVSIALFTDVSFDKTGKAEYSFITNRINQNGVIIPAKSPEGMFSENKIPNDLNIVVKAINEYYN